MPRRRRPAKVAIVLVPRDRLRELADLRNLYAKSRALWVWEREFIWDQTHSFYKELRERIQEGPVFEIRVWIDGSVGHGRYAPRPEITQLLAKGLSLYSGMAWSEDAFIKVDSATNPQALRRMDKEVRSYAPRQLPPPDLNNFASREDYFDIRTLAKEFCCSDQTLYNLMNANTNIRRTNGIQPVEYHVGDSAKGLLERRKATGRD